MVCAGVYAARSTRVTTPRCARHSNCRWGIDEVGVTGLQQPTGGSSLQAFDSQFAVDVRDDDSPILNCHTTVDHHFVSVGDAGVPHRPTVDLHDECAARVMYQMLAEVDGIFLVVVA